MLKDASLTRPEAGVCPDWIGAVLLELSRCLCSDACDGMDQQTEAVAEATVYTQPGLPGVPIRHARYWCLQGTWAVGEVPGRGTTGAGLPEAAKLLAMQVGTGAVLAEAEAGGNAVHEVGK
jgi:hypothetical protein